MRAAAIGIGLGMMLVTAVGAKPHLEVSERQLQLARYNELLAQGASAFAQGAFQTAVSRFEEACFAWGEFDRAGEHLRAGVRRRPSWARSQEGLAQLARRPGLKARRTDELYAQLAQVRSLDRLFLKGTLEYFGGDRAAARESFEEALTVDAGDLPTKVFLAALARKEAGGPPAASETSTPATPENWMGDGP
jgi:tetratricopeptide (TPR) repeat protein